jgi:hypothetical protein
VLTAVPALIVESLANLANSHTWVGVGSSGSWHDDAANISNADVNAISVALVLFFIFISAIGF